MATTYFWTAGVRSFVMTSCANGLRLGEELGSGKRPLFWALVLGVVIALAGSIWVIMILSHEYGASQFEDMVAKGRLRLHGEYDSLAESTAPVGLDQHWDRGRDHVGFDDRPLALCVVAAPSPRVSDRSDMDQ